MASSLIHMAITSRLNEKLKRDKKAILIGTIAPDISKLVGDTKFYSHYLDSTESDIPNIEKFLIRYKNNLDDDFVLGYYIHIYTDYLWFKYFISEIYDKSNNLITKLDGTIVECTGNMAIKYIYNDYTNLNALLIDYYNLDLDIFYNEIPKFKNIIREIPMDKLDVIINKTKEIINKSKVHKDMTFNIEHVHNFINLAVSLIEADLCDLGLLE